MKSAYELAMERLGDGDAPAKLTDDQKSRIADIEQKYAAKIAEKKLTANNLIAKARAAANYLEIADLEQRLAGEISALEEKCDSEKEVIRKESQ